MTATGGIAARFVSKSEPKTHLLRYEVACRALAEANSIDEVKDVRDKAEAFRHYARQAKNKELEINAAAIRIRAERRLGEMIQDRKAVKPQLAKGRRSDLVPAGNQVEEPTLEELGIDKKLSSRAQKIAAVPEEKFEGMMAVWRERVAQENERVTTALIKEGEKAERRAANHAAVEGGGTVEDLFALAASGYRAGTISADPAWSYETWSERGEDRSAVQHYHTETLEEIESRPVAQLAAPNSLLHLWCPSSMLESHGLKVIAAWGFEYKKVGFIWPKTTKDGSARKMGNGYWTRDEAEFCLLATRGHPERLDAGVRQIFDAPLGEHSEKPDEFYDRMRRLAGGPYLELYGRKERPGWTVWGDQVKWLVREWPDDHDIRTAHTADGEEYDTTTGEIIESGSAEQSAGESLVDAHENGGSASSIPIATAPPASTEIADGTRAAEPAGDEARQPSMDICDAPWHLVRDPVERERLRLLQCGDAA